MSDYISRKMVMKYLQEQQANVIIEEHKHGFVSEDVCAGMHAAVNAFINFIVQAPSEEAVPVAHGYNNNQNFHEVDEFCCSECGLHLEDWSRRVYDEENDDEFWVEYAFKYCPECGAKIKGGGK